MFGVDNYGKYCHHEFYLPCTIVLNISLLAPTPLPNINELLHDQIISMSRFNGILVDFSVFYMSKLCGIV